jgi:hypothetical protein
MILPCILVTRQQPLYQWIRPNLLIICLESSDLDRRTISFHKNAPLVTKCELNKMQFVSDGIPAEPIYLLGGHVH